jgi:PAS domain-containing protein
MAALMVPPALREGHRRSLATGEGPLLDSRMEIRVLRAEGTEIPVEIAVTRIGVEGPPLYTAYLRDITYQKAAQQALESTGARLQHLLISSPTVIHSMAATGDYACSFISENLLDLIGYQAALRLSVGRMAPYALTAERVTASASSTARRTAVVCTSVDTAVTSLR